MADAYKILGTAANRNPSATTDTLLYTVPGSTSTVLSTIVVANRSATATTFRVATIESGGTLGNQHYVFYDVPIAGNDTFVCTLGATLEAAATVRIYAGAATLTFTLYGCEVT